MKRIPILLLLSTLAGGEPISAAETVLKIALIGDSTVTDSAGWGKAFADRFDTDVHVLNFAMGGRSSKSWYEEKRLPAVLKVKPDYALIQFGHNDQPGKGPNRETDPATTYRDFLKLYVRELRDAGCHPILVSPVTRRIFDKSNTIASSLTPWAEAAKAVAKEMDVPFVDLHTSSVNYHNRLGPEASQAFNPKEGDVTHLNKKGAEAVADLIIKELKVSAKECCTHVLPSGTEQKP